MAENLIIHTGSKEEKYRELLPQLHALVSTEADLIANLANMAAALKQTFGFFWVGFYLVKEEELVLGPFQGPIACTRIRFGRGVCGTAWKEARTLIVPDVELRHYRRTLSGRDLHVYCIIKKRHKHPEKTEALIE